VDLVHDAGPPGNAYTISEPTQITIGVADPRHQGLAALELVFHEASHRWDAILMKGVTEAGQALKVRAPGGLWHGLLFFNAGTLTAEALAAAGIRDYVMYMEQERMWDGPYRGWRPAITTHWPAFLAGAIPRDEAIRRILQAGPTR
jgi:hypothetical protein